MAFLPDKTASLGRPHASNTPTISPISQSRSVTFAAMAGVVLKGAHYPIVSKRHQNGPTFTKAPPKKRRPMTDEERAALLDRKKAEQEETKRAAAKSRRFHQLVNKVGLLAAIGLKKG